MAQVQTVNQGTLHVGGQELDLRVKNSRVVIWLQDYLIILTPRQAMQLASALSEEAQKKTVRSSC